jgi:hypothetical protein
MSDADIIEIVKISVAAIGAIIVFFVGRYEYRKSIKIKRAEFLDKLIAEFLDKETEIARSLLDDYIYVTDELKGLSTEEQKQKAVKLGFYLRDHDKCPIKNTDEIKVRKSFDELFDFFTKLSYYLSNNLISASELTYFKYYLNKLEQKKDDVNEYINKYFYMKDFQTLLIALKKIK